MSLCRDPRLTYLNNNGYNVVLLPREGIEPLDVLGRVDGDVTRLGTMSQIWTSRVPTPSSGLPHPAASVTGTKTDDMDLSIGLGLLCNILNGMGAIVDLPKLTVAYQRARKVQYTFGEVEAVSIDPFAIGNFLASGDLRVNNPFVERYFDEEGTSAYVINEVLKSDSITVSSKDEHGTSVSVDLPAIQQLVSAKVSVTSKASEAFDLSYKASSKITFGFKAFGIIFTDGKWTVHGVKPSGDLAFGLTVKGAAKLRPILFGTHRLIRLGEISQAVAA